MLSDIFSILIYLIVGVITGIASGIFGIGGGVIFIPSLFFLLPPEFRANSVQTVVVIATSLFAGSFASSGSAFNHFKRKNINFKSGLFLISGSVITAAVVPYFVTKINDQTLNLILAFALLFVAVKFFFEKKEETVSSIKLNSYWLIVFGMLTGILSAVTGLGGGIVFLPLLIYLFGFDFRKAIGTSSFAVAFTMISSAISFSFHDLNSFSNSQLFGSVYLTAGIPLGVGALFGSKIGVNFIFNHSVFAIKKIFSLFLILFIIKLLFL